jgi:SOS-response transcriptional repressor LexA
MATNILAFPAQKPKVEPLLFAGLPVTKWVTIELPPGMLPRHPDPKNYTVIPIRGDGLQGDGIHHGDYVVTRKPFEGEQPQQGQLVAACTPKGLYVLRYYRTLRGMIRLATSHPDCEDLYFSDEQITIEGIYLHTLRPDEVEAIEPRH